MVGFTLEAIVLGGAMSEYPTSYRLLFLSLICASLSYFFYFVYITSYQHNHCFIFAWLSSNLGVSIAYSLWIRYPLSWDLLLR